jgi:hypothetical protein
VPFSWCLRSRCAWTSLLPPFPPRWRGRTGWARLRPVLSNSCLTALYAVPQFPAVPQRRGAGHGRRRQAGQALGVRLFCLLGENRTRAAAACRQGAARCEALFCALLQHAATQSETLPCSPCPDHSARLHPCMKVRRWVVPQRGHRPQRRCDVCPGVPGPEPHRQRRCGGRCVCLEVRRASGGGARRGRMMSGMQGAASAVGGCTRGRQWGMNRV